MMVSFKFLNSNPGGVAPQSNSKASWVKSIGLNQSLASRTGPGAGEKAASLELWSYLYVYVCINIYTHISVYVYVYLDLLEPRKK